MAPFIRDEGELQQYGLSVPEVSSFGATPPVQADVAQPAQPKPEEDLGVWDYAEDIFFSGVSGVGQAVQETTDLIHGVGNYIDNNYLGDSLVPEDNPIVIPKYESKTTAGEITAGASQFLTGFIGAGKFLKPFQLFQKLKAAGMAGEIAAGTMQGALADFAAFDPREGRFANVLQDMGIQNAVIDYLAADEADGEFEGRFKNVLEGAALGAVTEPLFMAFRAMRGSRKALAEGAEDEAKRILVEASDDIDSILRGDEAKPKFTPGEKIEVFSNAEGKIELRDVDADGNPLLKEGDKIVVEKSDEMVRFQPEPKPDVDVDRIKLIANAKDVTFRDFEGVFNYEKMMTGGDIHAAIESFAQATKSRWDDGVRSLKNVELEGRELAELAGADADEGKAFFNALSKDAQNIMHIDQRMYAAKAYLQGLTQEINKTARQVLYNPSKETEARLLQLMEHAEDVTVSLKTIQKEGARLLGAGRLASKPLAELATDDLDALISRAGGSEKLKNLSAKLLSAKDNPKATMRLVKEARKSGFMDVHNEYWVNSILSGPKTHVVNVTSNMIQTLMMPMDRIVGGALTMNGSAIKEGVRLYAGLAKYTMDAMRLAGDVLLSKEGQAILDAGHKTLDGSMGYQAIKATSLGMPEKSTLGRLVNIAGQIIRVPSRFLSMEDEFFKQLNYRAKVYADLVAKAVDEEGLQGSKAIAQYVEDNFDRFFYKNGAGKYKKAMLYSQDATFSRDLEYGFSKSLQGLAGRHPAIRVVLPFIRTPANIVRQVWQRTPIIGKFQKQLAQELASPDEIVQATAHGKVAIGSLLWTSAILAAGNGRITGAGPKNPKLREMWLEDGNQPYSVVTYDENGNKVFTQYNRLDPYGMFFGLAADYTEIAKQIGDEEAGELAIGMLVALTRNLTSKTYLKGIVDFINVVNDPERWGERYIQRQFSTYVPFSGLLGQVNQHSDGTMREVRSVADAMMNRIPGLSEKLPAKKSWITGEDILYPSEYYSPINIPDVFSPFPQKKAKHNVVLEELQQLHKAVQAPDDTIGNVELTGEQYSRLNELHGKLRINKRTMSETLERLITSEQYDRARQRVADAPEEYLTFRERAVTQVIQRYRKAAVAQLLTEFPELREKVVQDKINANAARRGMINKIKPILK